MSQRTPIRSPKASRSPLRRLIRIVRHVATGGRWRVWQERRLVAGRPPLTDAEYLRIQGASADDASLWLAARRSVAEACGLPREAIHPGDRMDDLWRLRWMGPDLWDVAFRLERLLGRKVSRAAIEREVPGGPRSFGQFAADLVRALQR